MNVVCQPKSAVLYANRSAASLKAGNIDEAIADGLKATEVRSNKIFPNNINNSSLEYGSWMRNGARGGIAMPRPWTHKNPPINIL